MAVIAALSSATPSLQSTLIHTRVTQARREAEQAEAHAQALRQQADEQERVGQQARDRVQTLERGARPERVANDSSQTQPRSVDATYSNILRGIFKAAKPVLGMNLSATQKNIVKSSLFDAAKHRTGHLLDTTV